MGNCDAYTTRRDTPYTWEAAGGVFDEDAHRFRNKKQDKHDRDENTTVCLHGRLAPLGDAVVFCLWKMTFCRCSMKHTQATDRR